MSKFIHTVHEYILLLVRYLAIFAVIGFMPIPLFTFFGGDNLTQIDHNPLFDYFNHYEITTDTILESVYTNLYISDNKNGIQEWEIDNAILWADAIAFKLNEEGIPVIRKVITPASKSKVESLQALFEENTLENPLVSEEIKNLLLGLKAKFELLLPVESVTENARQWIILALNSNEKTIKKELKQFISQFPNDNFLIITQTPVFLNKKTLQLVLPDFNIKQAKRVLSEGLKITQTQAEILLIDKEKSLWSLNKQNGENPEFSLKSLLGENYHLLNNLTEKQTEVLQKLCEEGKVKVGNKKLNLVDYGVRIKNKNYQWADHEALLNYQLQKETLCEKTAWIDVEAKNQAETQVKAKEERNQSKQQEKNNEEELENSKLQDEQKGEITEQNKREDKQPKKISKKDREERDSKKEFLKDDKKSDRKDQQKSIQENHEVKKSQNYVPESFQPESNLLD